MGINLRLQRWQKDGQVTKLNVELSTVKAENANKCAYTDYPIDLTSTLLKSDNGIIVKVIRITFVALRSSYAIGSSRKIQGRGEKIDQ